MQTIVQRYIFDIQREEENNTGQVVWVVCGTEGPHPLSDSVLPFDQSQPETSGADQSIHLKTDLIGPLHWFSAANDLIAQLSQTLDWGPYVCLSLI